MNANLKNLIEALELLLKDIKGHKVLTDDLSTAISMAQVNLVNATAADVTMAGYIKAIMRASFHLGQLHMAMDVLAGDKLGGKRVKTMQPAFRMWRETALEVSQALEEVIG
jgi:hypothetical protein